MSKKKRVVFGLALALFVTFFPLKNFAVEAEYPSNGAASFYGTYEPILKPGPTVPDNGNEKVTQILTSKPQQSLPQTNEHKNVFYSLFGLGLILITMIKLFYQKKENKYEKN